MKVLWNLLIKKLLEHMLTVLATAGKREEEPLRQNLPQDGQTR